MTKSEAAAILGRLGGSVRSEAKAAAVRANGAKGGRPPKLNAEVHVTRVGPQGVFGHRTQHCDAAGCSGQERFWEGIEPGAVQRGRCYELSPVDGGWKLMSEVVQ